VLKSGYYYKGEILFEDEKTIVLKDITNKEVTISKDQIAVKEVIND